MNDPDTLGLPNDSESPIRAVIQKDVPKIIVQARSQTYARMLSPNHGAERLKLLSKLQATPQKMNTLAVGLDAEEMELLKQHTREEYEGMESAMSALARLDAAILKHFDAEEADELRALARHTMGLYLNTHQYHNAVHALSMTRESLHLAEIANIQDVEVLRTLVIKGLYHDAGNGIHPTPPTTKEADEAQAVEIFMRDIREAQRRIKFNEDVGELAALARLRSVKVNGESVDQRELVAACIAATVFRDRFAPTTSLAFQEYISSILEHVHRTDPDFLPFREVKRFISLMESGPAWIARDADVAGSTYSHAVLTNNLLNREEDARRGMAADVGPVRYHNGFIGFIGAAFHQGSETDVVKTARGGSPLYLPEGQGNAGAIMEYGKQQLHVEKARFEKLIGEHDSMLTALFVLIGESVKNGESFLQLPLKEIHNRLAQLALDLGRLDRAKGVLTKEEITSLDLDLDRYPLLQDKRYDTLTIPAMTPGLVNRIFAPNTTLTTEQEEVAERLQEIERDSNPERQPVLLSILELADLNPEKIQRETFQQGTKIITKGTHPGRVFILLKGTASVNLGNGQSFPVLPGTVLGEMSALSDKEASADVVANTDVDAISLPADLVRNEYGTEELRIRMMGIMEKRQQQDRERTEES